MPAELVALAEWIAAEYCSTLARALALVLPPGATRRLSGRKRRAFKRTEHLPVGARAPQRPALSDEQRAVLDVLDAALRERTAHAAPAARRHRLGQDRGLPARGRDGARAGARRDRARAGDRADAADRRALHRALRRDGRGAALAAASRRALRRVAAAARGRGARLRRTALGGVRADRAARADRRRRGARRLLQARGRSALRRARGGRRAGAQQRRGAAGRQRDAARRRAPSALPRSTLARRVDGRPLPARAGARHARAGARPAPGHGAGARTRCERERSKAIVLLNRRGWSNFLSCRSCGRVWGCPECDVALVLHRAGAFVACHHCGHRERAPQRCPDCASTSVARHGAGTERAAARAGGRAERRWRLSDLPPRRRRRLGVRRRVGGG